MVSRLAAGGVTLAAVLAILCMTPDSATAGDLERVQIKAPEFMADSTWISSKPLTLAKLKGKVTVVHFWTNGCINCIHNYPAYKEWSEAFKGKDVVLVGIHTPEFESEKDVARIERKAKENGLTFPIVVDNDRKHWKAWTNQYWPCIYLVDKTGQVRYRWAGEVGTKGAASVRKKIEELLAE